MYLLEEFFEAFGPRILERYGEGESPVAKVFKESFSESFGESFNLICYSGYFIFN